MTAPAGRAMRGAAVAFAGATVYRGATAIREDLPGEPLGVRIPLSVSTAVAVGRGSAISAPWLIPLAGLVAVTRPGSCSGLVCAGLGLAGIVGICLEPNTYRAGTWSPAIRRAAFVAHRDLCRVDRDRDAASTPHRALSGSAVSPGFRPEPLVAPSRVIRRCL
jgi:hypothetical protein